MIAHSSALFQQSDSPLKQAGRHGSGGLQRLTLSPTPERFNSPQAGSGLRCGRLSRNGSCYWRVRRVGLERSGVGRSRKLASFYPILCIFRVPQKVLFPTPFSVPWHCCCLVIIRPSSTTNRDPDLHLCTRDHFQLLFTLKQSPRVHFRNPDTTVSVSRLISRRILI